MNPSTVDIPGDLPLFIYGTLLPGQANFPLFLQGCILECLAARTQGRLYLVPEEDYPYVVPGPGEVRGALIFLSPHIREQTLKRLDELEDYNPLNEEGSLYLRRQTDVTLEDGRRMRAWIYYWNGSDIGEPLPGGDFRLRRQRSR